MDDGCDSGYPSPRDDAPSTSTPSSGKKPSLNKHFPKLDEIRGESDGHGKTRIPRSKPSKTAADERKREEQVEERIRSEYQKYIDDLKFEKNEAKKLNEMAQIAIKEKEEEINRLCGQIAEFQESLDESKSNVDLNEKLRSRCKSLQNENDDLRNLLEKYEKEKEELKVITHQQEENSKSLFEETERLCEETAFLQEQLTKMQRESESTLEKYNALEREYNALKLDLKQKVEAYAVDRTRMEELQTEVETLKQKIEILHAQEINSQQELAELRKRHDELMLEKETKNKLQGEISEYQVKVTQMEITVNKLEGDKAMLQEEASRLLDKSNAFQAQFVATQKEAESFGRNYNDLEELYNKLETDFKRKSDLDRDRIEGLQNERDQLQQTITVIEEKMAVYSCTENGLRGELKECRKRNDEMLLKNGEQSDDINRLQTELKNMQRNNTELTHKCETAEGDKKRYVARLNDLNKEREEKEKLQKQLKEYQTKIAHLEEKLPSLESENNKIKQDLGDLRRKNDELESVNQHYARKDVETSSKFQTLERHLTGKQRECQQLSEKASSVSKQLEEAELKVKELSAIVAKNSEAHKNYVELEKLNLQLTNEIEYLRVKAKEQPSQMEHRQISEQLDHITAELRAKEQQLEDIEQKYAELDYKLKNVQPELDRSAKTIQQLEEEMDSVKRDSKKLKEELIEKCDSNTKLIEEFERFKGAKESEIRQYALRLTEVEANYATTHAQLQREIHLRALSSGECISSLWDGIPDNIRQQLPRESEDILKSIKIGSSCTPPPSSYSENGKTGEFSSKLAELLERYSLEKLSSTSVASVLFHMTSSLLRQHKDNLDSFVEPFASEIARLVEQRDQKYFVRISEIEQMKDEESREKREYHAKVQNLEDDLDSASNFIQNLQSQLAGLKAEFDTKLKIIETRDYTIVKLNEEVEALKEIRGDLQEQAAVHEKVATGYMEMISEYEAEVNQRHEELCSIEREAEVLKNDKMELESEIDLLQRENDGTRRKLKELEKIAFSATNQLEECKKRLIKEEKSKRYNQDTIRKCFEYIDEYKQAVEDLNRKNSQRRKVLEKITNDINILCSQKNVEDFKKVLNETSSKWKKDDEDISRRREETSENFNKMIRERATPSVNAAFKQARQQSRS